MKTQGLFIAGTDTDVGKTYVTALIARDTREKRTVGACKPACSGKLIDANGREYWPDVETLADAISPGFSVEQICSQRFSAPLAPPVAAREEHKAVDGQLLRSSVRWWEGKVELLLVEGVGGLLCPLTDTESVADLAVDLGYPVLIVARLGLGTINHTLLTVEAAERRGLKLAGIVLNDHPPSRDDPSTWSNPREISKLVSVPVLGGVQHDQSTGLLRDGKPITMDWYELAAHADV